MFVRATLALSCAFICSLQANLAFAQTLLLPRNAAFTPSNSSTGPVTVSGNTTGSLGNLCSSHAGIQTALQAALSGQDSAGLNLVIPASLTSPAGLHQVAEVSRCCKHFARAYTLAANDPNGFACMQIAWNYIVTYPLPFVAKSLAANSGNATKINTFFASNDHLSNASDVGTVTPNHDTLYNQAFLDLSQVQHKTIRIEHTKSMTFCARLQVAALTNSALAAHGSSKCLLNMQLQEQFACFWLLH